MTLWWRFLIFCVLVTFTLIVVIGCIHGRPTVHAFFNRCCADSIENDPKLFENFGNNFLMERQVSYEIVEGANETTVLSYNREDVVKLMEDLRRRFNVHDPRERKKYFDEEFSKRDELQDRVDSVKKRDDSVVERIRENDGIT